MKASSAASVIAICLGLWSCREKSGEKASGPPVVAEQLPEQGAAEGEEVAVPADREGGILIGKPDAPVILIVLTDYACPHCRDLHENVLEELLSTDVAAGNLAIEVWHLPEPADDRSLLAARVARVAGGAGKIVDAERLLFEWAFQKDFGSEPSLALLAGALDLDEKELLALPKIEGTEDFRPDAAIAEKVGLTAVPTVVVIGGGKMEGESVGRRISGVDDLSAYRRAIEAVKGR